MTVQAPSAAVAGTPLPAPGPAISLTFRAMACTVNLQVVDPRPDAATALDAARDVFARVESACTRFNPDSPLMQANAAGDAWFAVPSECYWALAEAAAAHERTGGLFDPRVLKTLVELGYDHSLPFADGPLALPGGVGPSNPAVARRTGEWIPGLDPATSAVRIGPEPVDLGGIGKGLAVRWAAQTLAGAGRAFLVEAGGDCYLAGDGPEATGWRVAVEDPSGGSDPVAVLRVADRGCATSSLRLRSWRRGDRLVHHLIDPRTGTSAAGGLVSVTVVDPDTATAEVWSKSLLVAGAIEIESLTRRHDLAAFWVTDTGAPAWSGALEPWLMWVTTHGG